ncbi:uncharacterized protein LOC129786714 [Lutzomyia longipalpis]|uniref:uncharacterized protein LOC129786714 n=1 Tax=Lutzomyia longipalpis TaxID=7200 RepID=UPI002484737E|nr:uncharacterized protein LOC129786714 [Lutzomyia longipalpis]
MESSGKSSNRITSAQQKLMFKFIEEHPQMLRSRFNKDYTMQEASRLWKRLSAALNATEGPKKSSVGWRKSWTNMKCLRNKPEGRDCTLPLPSGSTSERDFEDESLSFLQGSNDFLQDHVVVKHEDPLDIDYSPMLVENNAKVEKEVVDDVAENTATNLPVPDNQILSNSRKINEDPDPIEAVSEGYSDELARKQLVLMERQTIAIETLNQTLQFQGSVLLQLSESINNFSSTIRKMQNGNC